MVDGQDANLEQIRAGMALQAIWRGSVAGRTAPLAGAEKAAPAKGVGLWRDLKPVPPWDLRRK